MKYRTTIASMALLLLGVSAATAQSQDEQSACIGDAFSVCGHEIPNRDRVAACLADNMSRLSPGCRSVMARYNRPSNRANRYADERRSAPYRERYEYDNRDAWDRHYERRSFDGGGGWTDRDPWRTR